jgi:putative ABC transport system ATP-binding protein
MKARMTADDSKQVEIIGLSRSFREGDRRHDVLNGLDLEIAVGETVALRGRSGSGKSTLLNLISGIDQPDGGEIVVGGVQLTALPERARTLFRRRNIGFVYQAFNLVPTLDVGDNIRLVLELNGVGKHETDDKVSGLLEAVGLHDRIESYPDVLSGGEQQRVAIARALAHDPALLLADEPTGNLDEATAAGVLELMFELVSRAGKTMVMATHSNVVAAGCDRVVELQNGMLAG